MDVPDIIRRLVHEMKAQLKEARRLEVYRRNGVEAFSDRIAGRAAEGEILRNATTAERSKPHFVLEDIGERALKNVAEPTWLFKTIPPGLYEKWCKENTFSSPICD
jgi:hypothetical protein